MALTVTNSLDNSERIINTALGQSNLSEQTLVDVINSSNATSQPKVSVKTINYNIFGTGKVKIYYKNDTTKFVELTGNGVFGIRDTENILSLDINVIGDILLDSDSNVTRFFLIIECDKIGGYL
tara:strand:+ start:399 stop:770 length:372 start_codon:yes stop_codon:yes gene_type:complete